MIYYRESLTVNAAALAPAKYHYNCAIFVFNNQKYLCYRCQDHLYQSSWLAISPLDANNQPTGYQLLNTGTKCAEDPRVVVQDDKLFVFFNTGAPPLFKDRKPTDLTINMACYDKQFNLIYSKPLQYADRKPVEKNWQMLYTRGKWHAIYSVSPWQVIEFDENWVGQLIIDKPVDLPWRYGPIRGGASPVKVLPPAGRFFRNLPKTNYYSFFHSSYDHPVIALKAPRCYVAGLLSFDAETLLLNGYSRFPVILPHPKDDTVVTAKVVFPSGALFHDGLWTVSYGSGDCSCKIDILNHEELTCDMNFVSLK